MEKNYLEVIRKSGLKLTKLAERMDMSESLLRYYLEQEDLEITIERLFFQSIKTMLSSVTDSLEEVKRTNREKFVAKHRKIAAKARKKELVS